MVGREDTNSSFRAVFRAGRLGLQFVSGLIAREDTPSDITEESHSDSEEEEMGKARGTDSLKREQPSNSNSETDAKKEILKDDVAFEMKAKSLPSCALSRVFRKNQNGYVNAYSMLAAREANLSGTGKFSSSDRCHVASRYLPSGDASLLDKMNSRAYTGQFSTDGSLFVAAFQNRHIKVYDVENGWKVKKNVFARSLRWTVTDTTLSPDRRFLVYASLTPVVHLVNVGNSETDSVANVTEIHNMIDFSSHSSDEFAFGLFCIKFSVDGRELVAGSNDNHIYVYDLETNTVPLQLRAHEEDVNTVAFADETGHLIYSGSDDCFCKVWDRRCIQSNSQPAGSLVGHLEGITFIDSRGDGRHLITNGKDQTIKLWDIRKMSSGNPKKKSRGPSYRWDYRWMEYPGTGKDVKHPYDQSVTTYKGHSVLRTLIRCYFSPSFSTAQKYIYTGSYDGSVYIYDVITAEIVECLLYHNDAVRDCSWHPHYPTLVSSSWDGCVAKWDYGSKVSTFVLERS